ncbi:Ergothioneine biosynthesis protein 1 [Podospora pseudoanserina]|uniref:Ergothioneine biosynthesis protein 1 n=1 Tax=Podospora pseudoanserina TaxID=2609844 RepID=A0ABR0IC54_9PEZI|nr:Ergothioneine biosynthesis protein 1 [Podospora pseudoanserina]
MPSSAPDLTVMAYGALASLKAAAAAKDKTKPKLFSHPKVDIIDIRRVEVETNLKADIVSQFCPKEGPRKLPTLLLVAVITYLEEYYLTNDEIQVLESSAKEIAGSIPSGSMVIELGSGNLRKVNLLLQAFEDAGKSIDYYALDLSKQELERTLAQLPAYQHVRAHGLFGTYDDGREWLKDPSNISRRKCIMSLGSSIGNFERSAAASFLKSFSDVLSHGDTMLIGLDACNDPAKVYFVGSHTDKEGITHEFILNGLRHANRVLGQAAFHERDWRVIGEYVHDAEGGRHQAFYSPVRDTTVFGQVIRPHERVQVEESLKWSPEETRKMWDLAGMTEMGKWMHGTEYGLHLLTKSKLSFSLIPSVYARSALPTISDWEAVWAAWDVVTREMLPHEELLEKPIKLRNACIFYLGHIPTFLDIQLSKTTKEPLTEPETYSLIFERGIDPDVDNPELCHAHSEIPDEWPSVEDVLAYQNRVRARVQSMYASGAESIPRHVGRAVWVGFEHELMHLETLLYMMLQSDRTLPPSHVPAPDWEKLAARARGEGVVNEWFDIPEQEITIGLDDPEDGTDIDNVYGWDNEKPVRRVKVHSFQAQGRPITNEEYAQYLYNTSSNKLPASWVEIPPSNHTNGTTPPLPESFLHNKAVRTVYGPVPLSLALDWPVFASYDELSSCATYMGGRIPTFFETRSIYQYAEELKKKKDVENQLGKTVPAVNGHLCNNGVEISPPATPTTTTASSDAGGEVDLFIDLSDANVGLHNWHPVPVTGKGNKLAGQAEMGGVWEWTSSVLEEWEGFEAMGLYPGYTADFFDGKHNVVLGGSWATHPRIAGRRSFVNWYQRNYPYAWVGARLVRDI